MRASNVLQPKTSLNRKNKETRTQNRATPRTARSPANPLTTEERIAPLEGLALEEATAA